MKKNIGEEDRKGIVIMEEPSATTTTRIRGRRNTINVIKPRPRTFPKNSPWLIQNVQQQTNYKQIDSQIDTDIDRSRNDDGDVFVPKLLSVFNEDDHDMQWLENLWSEEIWGGANGGGDGNRTQNDFTNFYI